MPMSIEALAKIATLLLEEQIGTVWVEGEISNLRVPGSGHLYFALKDAHAQIPAVMWRSAAQRLPFRLEEGMRILVRARPGIYPEQGKFQLYIESAEPAGLGAASLALEQLKQRLAAEGLFDDARKRPLPKLPRRIGVVTSPTGAAVRDIIRVIQRRFPVPIVISPTRVQGDGVGAEIAAAISLLRDVDVMIVGRGGGSSEDLSAFNDEVVVRAIAACPVPVVSAVGHEVDVTLADLVADLRASTPTAAGELVVPERRVLAEELAKIELRLRRESRIALSACRTELDKLTQKLGEPRRRLERERLRLDEALVRSVTSMRTGLNGRRRQLAQLAQRLAALHPKEQLVKNRGAVAQLEARAHAAWERALSRRRRNFVGFTGRLDAMSPLKVLDRGYALARTADGRVVTDSETVTPGQDLSVRVARGELDVRVTAVRK